MYGKKTITILLVLTVIVSLFTACGGSQKAGQQQTSGQQQVSAAQTEQKQDTATQTTAKKTIVIYAVDVIKDKDVASFYKNFEDQNNATVKSIIQPSDKYVQNFMVAVNGGQQIDVLLLNGQDVRAFSNKGIIQDMTGLVNYWDRFIDPAVNQITFNGKRFAVPVATVTTSGVYYNKEILQKYNLQPPKTLADLISANKELNKHGISAFSFGGATTYMWPMWYFDALAQTSGNKSIERTVAALEGNAKFTDQDFVDAMKVLETFGKENLFQKGFNGVDSAAGLATFVSGKSAMFFGGSWEIDAMRSAGLKQEQLGIIPFPIIKDGAKSEQTGSAVGGALSLYSKISPDNKDLALKLIDYISSDAQNTAMLKILNSVVSCNKNVKIEGGDPLFDDIQKELVPSTVTLLDWIWPPEITKEFQNGIQAVVGGKIKAEDEMARIQKEYDDIKVKGYDFNAVQ